MKYVHGKQIRTFALTLAIGALIAATGCSRDADDADRSAAIPEPAAAPDTPRTPPVTTTPPTAAATTSAGTALATVETIDRHEIAAAGWRRRSALTALTY